MTPDGVLVRSSPGEMRFAVTSVGQIVEFRIDRGDAAPGDIILGRVLTCLRPLGAALVDIGQPLPGFLRQAGSVSEGQAVMVQVTASARGEKGAELTAEPSLQGVLLAYSPFRPGFSLSRRIAAAEERTRLTALLKGALAEGEGLVVRTQADGAAEDVLMAELTQMRERWAAVMAAKEQAVPPKTLSAVSPVRRLLADRPGISRMWVEDSRTLAAVRPDFPSAQLRPRCWDEAEELLEECLRPRVDLAGGGALEFGSVAGIVVVDIDSGPGGPLQANQDAVGEIPRQLRLRNLSGHILIDLIPMRERRHQAQLAAALRQGLSGDPSPSNLAGVTPMGMLEVIRERRGASLEEALMSASPARLSDDSQALLALRAVLREAETAPGRRWGLEAAPSVAAALRLRSAAVAEAEERLGHALSVRDVPGHDGWTIIEVR